MLPPSEAQVTAAVTAKDAAGPADFGLAEVVGTAVVVEAVGAVEARARIRRGPRGRGCRC